MALALSMFGVENLIVQLLIVLNGLTNNEINIKVVIA